jgi:hypothetical protein
MKNCLRRKITLKCTSATTIKKIQEKLASKGNTRENKIRLIFAGIELQSNFTLGDYNIDKNCDKIYAVLR